MNTLVKIAHNNGRDYITPEDVGMTWTAHDGGMHIKVRAEICSWLCQAQGAKIRIEDPTLCAFVAFEGPEETRNNRKEVKTLWK